MSRERVYDAVSGTEGASTAADDPEYPTVDDLSTYTGLARTRVLHSLGLLLDADAVQAVRRSDGAIGWGAVDESSDETTDDTENL